MSMESLLGDWRADLQVLRKYDARAQAITVEVMADALEAKLREGEEELLDLQEAAQESGYSADHLGRLVREGKIPNLGQKNAPRVRRGDLPQKPAKRAARSGTQAHGEGNTDRLLRNIINSKFGN